ncbi:hypothetical protein B0I37DRAFT_135761 [Chaetomium sp. MPI-CAGE-AT-0009]|nr:hypothetical protein B0I37DRAFT_135761 [Chaetomium sp. MPI-CAGE-AT-0009]
MITASVCPPGHDIGTDSYLLTVPSGWCVYRGRVRGTLGVRPSFVDGDSRYAATADEGTPSSFRLGVNSMPIALINHLQALYASILIYNVANNVVKMSFTPQYRRIFGSSSPTANRVCRWFFCFLLIWAATQAVLMGIACLPIASIVPSMAGKCLDPKPVWYTGQSLNVATDFVLFSVPLPYVYRLTLPTKEKVLVLGIFSLGFFTWTISAVRLSYLTSVLTSKDPTCDNVELTLWSVAELNCGILCACLQTLRPLLSRFRLFSACFGPDTRRCVRRPLGDGVFLELAPSYSSPSGSTGY